MANTKLTGIMKSARKEMLADFSAAGGKLFNFEGFTVAIKPAFIGSTMAIVSVSCASPDEQKTRRKVGEFYALSKILDQGEFIQLPLREWDFADFAENTAEFFSKDALL